MTSLTQAFDHPAPAGQTARTEQDGVAAPSAVGPRRYVDSNGEDEGERRYRYEQGRQKLYARGPPQRGVQLPSMASQESFQELGPGSGYGGGGGGSAEAPQLQRAPVSCGSCQQDMCCSPDGLFCVACNRAALGSAAAGAAPITNLFR
jgi:hypothetical protein